MGVVIVLPSNGVVVKQEYNRHMTFKEVKLLYKFIKKHCSMKYEIFFLLALTRALRPAEACAINIRDFKGFARGDFSRLTYREAKTNKIRCDEFILSEVAEKIREYVETHAHQLKAGFLFPWYSKRGKHITPYMTAQSLAAWFCKARQSIGRKHPEFLDSYPAEDGTVDYRIGLYSLRRFSETYIYNNNEYNLELVKEIMEYSKSFTPLGSYIRTFHKEEEKDRVLYNTFKPLLQDLNGLVTGQTQLENFI